MKSYAHAPHIEIFYLLVPSNMPPVITVCSLYCTVRAKIKMEDKRVKKLERLEDFRSGMTIQGICLIILDDADLGSPEYPPIELEALALSVHDITIFHTLGLGHECGFMHIGVELLRLSILSRLAGVESFQSMLLQGIHQDMLGHLQAGYKIHEFLILVGLGRVDLLIWHGQESPIKVVNTLQEVDGKSLDSKVTGIFHITFRAFLEVEEIRNRTNIFILQINNFFFLLFKLLAEAFLSGEFLSNFRALRFLCIRVLSWFLR